MITWSRRAAQRSGLDVYDLKRIELTSDAGAAGAAGDVTPRSSTVRASNPSPSPDYKGLASALYQPTIDRYTAMVAELTASARAQRGR